MLAFPKPHFGNEETQRRGAAGPQPDRDDLGLTQSAQRDWRGSQRDEFSVAFRIYTLSQSKDFTPSPPSPSLSANLCVLCALCIYPQCSIPN